MTQLLVIVEVLIAQRQPIDALRYHLGYRMLDARRIAAVEKALGKAAQQPDAPVNLTQQRRAAVGGEPVGGKLRHHPA